MVRLAFLALAAWSSCYAASLISASSACRAISDAGSVDKSFDTLLPAGSDDCSPLTIGMGAGLDYGSGVLLDRQLEYGAAAYQYFSAYIPGENGFETVDLTLRQAAVFEGSIHVIILRPPEIAARHARLVGGRTSVSRSLECTPGFACNGGSISIEISPPPEVIEYGVGFSMTVRAHLSDLEVAGVLDTQNQAWVYTNARTNTVVDIVPITIPEPATTALFTLGAVALVLCRRLIPQPARVRGE